MSTWEPLFARVKAETQAQHRALEGVVTFLDERAPQAGYARYLSKLFGFHAVAEPRLFAHASWLQAREKTPLLVADLAVLGVAAPALPRCDCVPSFTSRGQALGAAYVLEGATLGGRHVHRRLKGRIPESATRYLLCYGEEVGRRWSAFREEVRAVLADSEEDAFIAGARETFDALHRWLVGDAARGWTPHPGSAVAVRS